MRTTAIGGIALLALAGCASTTPGEKGSDDSAPKPNVSCEIADTNIDSSSVDTSELEGEITFMTQGLKGTFDPFFENLIADFEAQHDVKVNWTDQGGSADFDTLMVTQASNCSMADVINVPSSTVMALSAGDFLMDFDTKRPGIGETFVPKVWDSIGLGHKGAHTALPWYFGPFVTTFNKEIFEQAGLDPEQSPKTMDDYFDAADQIAANTDKGAVYGNTSWYMVPQWRSMGVELMNDDNTEFTFADDERALEWVTRMADLYENGGIPKDSITGDLDMSQAFGGGELAFGTPNVSFLRNVLNNAPAVYDTTGAGPSARDEGIAPLFNGQFIGVPVTTKNAPLAVAFAEYITSAEQGLAWAKYGIDTESAAVFPVTTEALNDPALVEGSDEGAFNEARKIAAEEAKLAEAYIPMFYVTGAVSDALVNNVNLAIAGQVAPEEALAAAESEMNSLLKRLLDN